MLDFIDLKILRALCKNGRITYANLAEQIHLSQTPTLKRVKRIEESGYVTGYTAIVDENRLGGSMNVFVMVTLASQKIATHHEFRKLVADVPQIMECFLTSGDSDYLLRIAVDSMAEYEKILTEKISSVVPVTNIRSSFSLRPVRRETTPPLLSDAASVIYAR